MPGIDASSPGPDRWLDDPGTPAKLTTIRSKSYLRLAGKPNRSKMHTENRLDQLDEAELIRLVNVCPLLHFSEKAESDLIALLGRENNSTAEMAGMIRRKRGMTARILRAVNSAYYGLAEPVHDIEEAILYMGLNQVRRIVLASPVLEEPEDFGNVPAHQVKTVWRHAMASAVLTQEIVQHGDLRLHEEISYQAGLLHDVGHLVMAAISPERFNQLKSRTYRSVDELMREEERLFTRAHPGIGALYLKRLPVSPEVVNAVAHHHTPEDPGAQTVLAAVVALAEELARRASLDGYPKVKRDTERAWTEVPAWRLVFGNNEKRSRSLDKHLRHFLPSLPELLHGFS